MAGSDGVGTRPASKEWSRWRRGEIIDVLDATGRTPKGNPALFFVRVYMTDVPDNVTRDRIREWLQELHTRSTSGVVHLAKQGRSGTFVQGETITAGATTATVTRETPDFVYEVFVSGVSGGLPDIGTQVVAPVSGAVGVFADFEREPIGQTYRFIPVSALPASRRNALQDDGYTVATFTQVKSFVKRRVADVEARDQTDNDAVDDDGAPS